MNREEKPITDELATLLDEVAAVLHDLVLAVRETKADVCEALDELRHRAASRLYELGDRLLETESDGP